MVHTELVAGNIDERYSDDFSKIVKLGFQWHMEDRNMIGFEYKFEKFKKMFEDVCDKLNKAIATHHGITCTIEHNAPNRVDDSVFILHFGDVLIHQISKVEMSALPEVRIQSAKLSVIPENMVDTLFDDLIDDDNKLSPEEKLFIVHNADLFYHIYAYWHNYSNKAVRTSCTHLNMMKRSKQLQETDDYYMRLQVAKQNELERKCHGQTVRDLYLVD